MLREQSYLPVGKNIPTWRAKGCLGYSDFEWSPELGPLSRHRGKWPNRVNRYGLNDQVSDGVSMGDVRNLSVKRTHPKHNIHPKKVVNNPTVREAGRYSIQTS